MRKIHVYADELATLGLIASIAPSIRLASYFSMRPPIGAKTSGY